jgi:hypothetical protein
MSPSRDTHLTWPPQRFYFAVVDAPPSRRSRRSIEQILYAAEPQLPVPLEELHAATAPGTNGRIIFCAVPREALQEVPHSALTLSPSELPEFLVDEAAPEQFNLLTGPFEPQRIRRMRRAGNVFVALTMVVVGAAIIFGLRRRTAACDEAATAHTTTIQTVTQRAIQSTQAHQSTQQLFLMLTAELRTLRQTRSTGIVDPQLFDAPGTLADVLALWPSELNARTESLSVTRTQIVIRAEVPASADVQRLADSLSQLPGWQLRQPRVDSTAKGGASCTITLVPVEDS